MHNILKVFTPEKAFDLAFRILDMTHPDKVPQEDGKVFAKFLVVVSRFVKRIESVDQTISSDCAKVLQNISQRIKDQWTLSRVRYNLPESFDFFDSLVFVPGAVIRYDSEKTTLYEQYTGPQVQSKCLLVTTDSNLISTLKTKFRKHKAITPNQFVLPSSQLKKLEVCLNHQ